MNYPINLSFLNIFFIKIMSFILFLVTFTSSFQYIFLCSLLSFYLYFFLCNFIFLYISTFNLILNYQIFFQLNFFYIQGWGKDKWEDGDYQVILKSVQMPVVNSDSCLNQLKTTKLGRRFR